MKRHSIVFKMFVKNIGCENFKTLVEEVRRELAISYLTEKQKSIGEITYLLGYTEPANFGRSFKKWTGKTPGAFRAST